MSWNRGKSTYLLSKPGDIVPWNTPEASGDPTPMFRAQAWALQAAYNRGARFSVTSANRRDETLAWFNKKYNTHHQGQGYLYNGFVEHRPGFYPANPPTRTSHCGYQDGSPFYPSVGKDLYYLRWGIDCVDAGSVNDAARTVRFLHAVGVPAAKAYPGESSENHHICITATPFQCWNALFKQRKPHNSKAWDDYTWEKRPAAIRRHG